jgi:hypothetical protein
MIYLTLCFLWDSYSFYKQRVSYKPPFNCLKNCFRTFVINFILMPISIIFLYKKIKNGNI